MINPTLASGFETEGEEPIVGTRRALGELTAGQRWTAALAVGLAVAILTFGMPERAAPAAAPEEELPAAGIDTPAASGLPPLSLAPSTGLAALADLGVGSTSPPRATPPPETPPQASPPTTPPTTAPPPACAPPIEAPPLLAALVRALFCDLMASP